jgi:hypothetical protein
MHDVTIEVEGRPHEFRLDFGTGTWTPKTDFDEADFPLIAVVEGARYELFSDGTLAEADVR